MTLHESICITGFTVRPPPYPINMPPHDFPLVYCIVSTLSSWAGQGEDGRGEGEGESWSHEEYEAGGLVSRLG
jgi:hypothetical protein